MASDGGGEPSRGEPGPQQNQPDNISDSGKPDANCNTNEPGRRPQRFDRIISSLTLLILFLTFLAALYAGHEADRLATDTEQAIEEARTASNNQYNAMVGQQQVMQGQLDAMRASQRPFVFLKSLIFERVTEGPRTMRRFVPIWENVGSSPTTQLALRPFCGIGVFDVIPPFDAQYSRGGAVNRVLGPKQTSEGGRCWVSDEDFDEFKKGNNHLFVGGQAVYGEYADPEHPHITEFCYSYLTVVNDSAPPNSDAEVGLGRPILCHKHNCADAECFK